MSDDVERTADGHHIIVNGRKWRASDPNIPARLHTELVAELMAARRAVAAAKRADDESLEQAARRRVSDAKNALGERGRPWWEPVDEESLVTRSGATTRTLLRHRAHDSSICPSEVARTVHWEHWRDILPTVRQSVDVMVTLGEIVMTRGESVVESSAGGPVRLRRGPNFPDAPV